MDCIGLIGFLGSYATVCYCTTKSSRRFQRAMGRPPGALAFRQEMGDLRVPWILSTTHWRPQLETMDIIYTVYIYIYSMICLYMYKYRYIYI